MSDKDDTLHSKETGRSRKEGTTKPSRRRIVADTAKETVQFVGPGDVLEDRYKILEELGRGGMGIVFKAFDRSLEMNVAIKVLPPELSGSKRAIRDLKREAKMAMQLNHPGIMALRHFADSGNVKFLVMELLEGQSLDDKLVEVEILDVEEVCQLAAQIGEALDFAHSTKVVHRDIKPANIFLKNKGDGYTVSLMDFGIARQIKDSMSRVSKVDTSGTLCYISPEQMRGQRADGRADIYSLAASLYECLAGHPPFYRGTISFQILNEKPAPIEDIPEHVNEALLRALAKKPEERFATATEFARALSGEIATTAATSIPVAAIGDGAVQGDGAAEQGVSATAQGDGASGKAADVGTSAGDKRTGDKRTGDTSASSATRGSKEGSAGEGTGKKEASALTAPIQLSAALQKPFFKHAVAPLLLCLILSSLVFATFSNSLIAQLFGQPVLDNRPRPRPVRYALKKGLVKTAKHLADYWRTVGAPSEKMCLALVAGVQVAMKGAKSTYTVDSVQLATAIYPPEDERIHQGLIEATGRAKADSESRRRKEALREEREAKARAEAAARAKALDAENRRKREAEAAQKREQEAAEAREAARAKEAAREAARAKEAARAHEAARAKEARERAAREAEKAREAASSKRDAQWQERRQQRAHALFNPQVKRGLFPRAHQSSAPALVNSLNTNPTYNTAATERKNNYLDVFASSDKAYADANALLQLLKKGDDANLISYRNFLNNYPALFNEELKLAMFVAEKCSPVVGFALFSALPAHPGRKSNLEKIARYAKAVGDNATYEAAVYEQGRSETPLTLSKSSPRPSQNAPVESYYAGPVRCTFRLSVYKYSYDFVKRVTLQLTPQGSGATTSGSWDMQVVSTGKTKTVRPYITELNVQPGSYRITVYVDGWTRMPLPIAIPTLKPGSIDATIKTGLRTANINIGTYNMKKGR